MAIHTYSRSCSSPYPKTVFTPSPQARSRDFGNNHKLHIIEERLFSRWLHCITFGRTPCTGAYTQHCGVSPSHCGVHPPPPLLHDKGSPPTNSTPTLGCTLHTVTPALGCTSLTVAYPLHTHRDVHWGIHSSHANVTYSPLLFCTPDDISSYS